MRDRDARARRRATRRGFTLIEMLIVMAVLAILAAVAIPAYSDYILRSRATAAVGVLKDLRARMEQRYADDRSYALAAGGCTIGNFTDKDSGFAFACVPALLGQSYTWTATGNGPAAGFRYSVDEAGVEQTLALPTAWAGSVTLPASRFVTRKGN